MNNPVTDLTSGIPWTAAEWKRRRIRLDIALTFCYGMIIWGTFHLMYENENNIIISQIVQLFMGMLFALLGSYIFGAIWDDNNFRKNTVKLAEITGAPVNADPNQPVDPTLGN